ncbi:MAG TPA: hypothetical protein VF175_17065, partial [Lacipirellula sp.]
MQSITRYFNDLSATIGAAWNRLWFTPTRATTLGGLRIATGLLALLAVATYLPDLERWFGEDGMLPMALIRDLYRPEGQILGQRSVFDVLPPEWITPAYWISLGLIALYTLGVGGRWIAAAATVATISFFTRAPLVIGEFEQILALLMIYLCIGRASDAFSLAALWRKKDAPSNSQHPASSIQHPSALNTISLRLIQIHIALVHLMMGYAQLAAPESAWWSGEGIWLAAGRPGMPLVDLSGLEDNFRVLAAWSHAMTIYLLAQPIFIWNRLARPLVLALGACVWLSF